MVTLHAYILRELLKAFGLTIVLLSALFTMAGGLYNALRFEGVTPGDLFTVLPMLIPIVVTFTMPVAALFAATITYGRLAADNEFVAARAAGVNIHRLFLAAGLLAVFVALFTGLSVNLVIPGFMKRIEYFARGNVRDMAYQRLLQRGYIRYGKAGRDQYILTAQQVLPVGADELVAKGFERPDEHLSYFWVNRPTFLMIDAQAELKRFAVAEGGLCQFDTRGRQVRVTVYVKDARDYVLGQAGVGQVKLQKFGPYPAPIRFPVRPSMLDLATLVSWRDAPWLSPELDRDIEKLTAKLRAYVFYVYAERRLADGGTLTLQAADGKAVRVRAGSCAADRKSLALADVTVEQMVPGMARPTRFVAPQGRLLAPTNAETGRTTVVIELVRTEQHPVREYNAQALHPDQPFPRDSVRLTGLVPPAKVVEEVSRFTPDQIVDPRVPLPGQELFSEQRAKLVTEAGKLRRKVKGLIHFRLGFSLSALVTVLMGAALGVMFRGARALAAFGLACIPFGIVTILMLMGRQLTEHPSTEAIGPYVIWAGLTFVAIADAIVLRVGVRR